MSVWMDWSDYIDLYIHTICIVHMCMYIPVYMYMQRYMYMYMQRYMYMYMYMHMYMYMYMHMYMYICVYVDIHTKTNVFTYMYTCRYIYLHTCMYIYMYMYMHMCVYVCIHAGMHVCVYVCMYAYIYIYTYIYTHIYIYIYLHIISPVEKQGSCNEVAFLYLESNYETQPPTIPHRLLGFFEDYIGNLNLLESPALGRVLKGTAFEQSLHTKWSLHNPSADPKLIGFIQGPLESNPSPPPPPPHPKREMVALGYHGFWNLPFRRLARGCQRYGRS